MTNEDAWMLLAIAQSFAILVLTFVIGSQRITLNYLRKVRKINEDYIAGVEKRNNELIALLNASSRTGVWTSSIEIQGTKDKN